jgi:hypothetical protein
MTTLQATPPAAHEPALTFDFRRTLQPNRLKGLWQMMSDYRLSYIVATIALATSALSKTYTYILLRYFADDVLAGQKYIGGSSAWPPWKVDSRFFRDVWLPTPPRALPAACAISSSTIFSA